ncbi:hypothetical protein MMC19_001327 [Ptychographa xylographoides]|nr:hypothetical protein [Ptychographa xylographoides]
MMGTLDSRTIAHTPGSLLNGNYYNISTLNLFNYTYYPNNGTVSNASACYLALPQLHPVILPNGTWINATWCYDPYYSVRTRGGLGIVYACLFAVSVIFTLGNLRKHGRLFLPQEKRFRAIGRRWQWYWMLFVATCGVIGGVSAIDVDRDYLQDIAIVLQIFFFYLLIPGLLAAVWEGVRHWGSWQERQAYDQDPFSLPQNDRRGRKEFYMPLIFYLLAWLNFFMNIPRNWGAFDSQGSPQQMDTIAMPAATDIRFKLGGIFAFGAWCIICWAMQHAVHYYKPRNTNALSGLVGLFRYSPTQFLLTIPLLLVLVGYAIVASFLWEIHPGNQAANSGWLYGLGYTPAIVILFVNETAGYLNPNEDRVLIKLRIDRGQAIDAEIGHLTVRKPWWWRKVEDRFLTDEQRLKALTTEIGGGQATAYNIVRNIEMGNMPLKSQDDDPNDPSTDRDTNAFTGIFTVDSDSDGDSGRAESQKTLSTTTSGPQQQVRSMLNV